MKIGLVVCALCVLLSPNVASGDFAYMIDDYNFDSGSNLESSFNTTQSNITTPIFNGTDGSLNSTVGSNSTIGNQTNQWYPPPPYFNQTVDFNGTVPGNTTDNTTASPPPPVPIEEIGPSPSPPIEGGAGNEPCIGMVYDGYLTNCNVYLDSNENLKRDLEESFGVSNNGQFTLIAPMTNLSGYIVRMEPSAASFLQLNPKSSECHDISTLLPEMLPLAAKAPETCSGNSEIMLSPLSTLLTMPGVSQQALESAFNLPPNSSIGSIDNLRRALDGDQTGLSIMKREMQVKNLVSQISRAITLKTSAYSKVAAATFESLSRAIIPPSLSVADTNGLTRTRKLLYQSDVHLYNVPSVLSAMFTDIFQTLAANPDISVTDLSFPQNTTQTAIFLSIANMNGMLENHTSSVDDIYRVAIVIQRDVLSSIEGLVNGTVTVDDFIQATSLENLVKTFNETSLPEGSTRDPLEESTDQIQDASSSSSLALGLGLGLGLGLPLILYIAYIIIQKKKEKKIPREPGSVIVTKEESPAAHSLTASPSYNVV